MNKHILDQYVEEKYGNNVKLTKENIKDIYFITYCNNFMSYKYIHQFINEYYSKEKILK